MNTVDAMQNCESVDEVKELLAKSEKGQIYNTLENYKTIFLNDPLLKEAFSYNLLTNRVDIVRPLGWYRESDHLTDVDVQYLMLYLDKYYHLSSEKKINGVIQVVANEFRYHPIRNYLNALQWDSQERVRHALHHFLGAEDDDYTYEVLKLFMLGAVTRVFEPGTKFEQMLCLVGGQGAGKSTFFRFLAIKDEWFTDDLRKLDDENVYRKLQGHWIIEMSEMIATVSARTIEDIKSFLSRQTDTYKTPYAVHPKDFKRQCVFGGTSNSQDFLPLDRTGNRRFLPVQVHPENAEVHILENEKESRAYIDQMWAEVMVIYRRSGPDLKLTLSKDAEDHLMSHQEDFMPEDERADRILNYLESYKGDTVCSLQLFHDALDHPSYEEPKQYDIREINSIMNNFAVGWRRFNNPRHLRPFGRQKGWERIREDDNTGGIGKGDNMDGFEDAPEEVVRMMEQMELPLGDLKPRNQ